MSEQEKQFLDEDFCSRFGIQSFEISPEFIDLDSGFLGELQESLQAGYDQSRPIVISQSSVKELNHIVLDGKHRCLALYNLERRGIHVTPMIVHRKVSSIEQVLAITADFVLKSKSKNNKLAQKIIDDCLTGIVEKKVRERMPESKIPGYITSLGFGSSTMVIKLVAREKHKRQPKKTSSRLQSVSRSDWGLREADERTSADASILAKPGETDILKFYRPCPSCKDTLQILTKTDGTLLEIKHVGVEAK